MSYQIREAKLIDADAISDCIRESFKHYIPLIGKEPEPMILDYADVVRERSAFVLADGSGIVGAIVLADGNGVFMWLDILGVRTEYQKNGYGKKLIEFGESVMLKRGATESRLYTNVKFEETIAIYKHLGYEEYDRKVERGYDRVFLRKALIADTRHKRLIHGGKK